MGNKKNRHLTILHSNDLHASFLADEKGENIIGGFPLLAGYVNQVRDNNPKSTMYVVAGDLFSGNLIDFDSKGVKSVMLLNEMHPDAVCIGNHSVDHTAQRLGFLQNFCDFPVLNANLYVKEMDRPYLKPYQIIKKNGINILLIGVVTEEIMKRKGKDSDLGDYLEYKDSALKIKEILYGLDTSEIDLTIVLSHLGYEEDFKLADSIEPFYGVDMIIGGHSHTTPTQAKVENGIIIVQAGCYSDRIGRFDLTVDTKEHKLLDYRWDIVPIDNGHGTKKSEKMDLKVSEYHRQLCEKYPVLLHWEKPLIKEEYRYKENLIGNFFCDLLAEMYKLDLCLIGSGSLRKNQLGPEFSGVQLREMYCVNEVLFKISLTGRQIKDGMLYALKKAPVNIKNDGEYYQVNNGCYFWWDGNPEAKELTRAEIGGKSIVDDQLYTVGIEDFHYYNMKAHLNLDAPECEILTTKTIEAIEKYLRMEEHQNYKPCYELQNRTKRDVEQIETMQDDKAK